MGGGGDGVVGGDHYDQSASFFVGSNYRVVFCTTWALRCVEICVYVCVRFGRINTIGVRHCGNVRSLHQGRGREKVLFMALMIFSSENTREQTNGFCCIFVIFTKKDESGKGKTLENISKISGLPKLNGAIIYK